MHHYLLYMYYPLRVCYVSKHFVPLVFLIDPVGGHNRLGVGLLWHCLVAPNDGREHLRPGEFARGESLDMSRRRCVLQRIHHLGCCGAASHVWKARYILEYELVLPHRLGVAGGAVGSRAQVPAGQVAEADQLSHHIRGHRDDAPCKGRELLVLGCSGIHLQLCGVQEVQAMVG